MIDTETAYMIIIGLLAIHLFFFMGFQYQLLQMLDELAFPSDDPIMTSTLEDMEVFDYEETPPQQEPEVFTYEEASEVEEWDNKEPEAPEVFEYAEETKEASKPTTSVLYEVGDYTESGEATLRQIKGMRKEDVIGICEIHGLDTEGTKAQLIERIKENAA
ncbi:MAG: hypothetical protein CM15mV57_210 [uncultured marine virus]|nr:MAG: hypothetical protein CM15mV57_210 [uncultured marine virus]